MSDSPLHPRWNALCLRVGAFKNAQETELTFDMVKTLYTHPPRAYHNLAHIEQVLSEFDQVFRLADDRDAVEMALWLHDCVDIAARPDNEERSADGRWHQPRTNLKRATDRGSGRSVRLDRVSARSHIEKRSLGLGLNSDDADGLPGG